MYVCVLCTCKRNSLSPSPLHWLVVCSFFPGILNQEHWTRPLLKQSSHHDSRTVSGQYANHHQNHQQCTCYEPKRREKNKIEPFFLLFLPPSLSIIILLFGILIVH